MIPHIEHIFVLLYYITYIYKYQGFSKKLKKYSDNGEK